jgi:hypothetical protein
MFSIFGKSTPPAEDGIWDVNHCAVNYHATDFSVESSWGVKSSMSTADTASGAKDARADFTNSESGHVGEFMETLLALYKSLPPSFDEHENTSFDILLQNPTDSGVRERKMAEVSRSDRDTSAAWYCRKRHRFYFYRTVHKDFSPPLLLNLEDSQA